MGVNVSKMLDALATTLAQYPSKKYRNMLVRQSYVFREMLRGLKPKEMSGTKAVFNAIICGDSGDTNHDATVTGFGRYDGAYDKIPVKAASYMTQGEIAWASYIGHWSISEKELMMNGGKEGYIDLGKATLEGSMTRLANILEDEWWATDTYLLQSAAAPAIVGPEYWITDDGYHFADPGGTLGLEVGGINPADSAYNDAAGRNRWRNQFQQIGTPNELPDAMDNLFLDCGFKAPPDVTLNTDPTTKRQKIVFNKNGFKSWKKLMRRLNEPFNETNPTFNNVKVEWSDSMKARTDGTNQGMFFNLDTWAARVAAGKDFSRTPVRTPDGQPSVRMQYFELWPAVWCEDRRQNGKVFGFGNELVEG